MYVFSGAGEFVSALCVGVQEGSVILKGAFTVDRKMKEYVHFPAKSSASGVTDTVSISLYAIPFFLSGSVDV